MSTTGGLATRGLRKTPYTAAKQAWTKYKLKYTYGSIDKVRSGLDQFNRAVNAAQRPIRKVVDTLEDQAAWVFGCLWTLFGMLLPLYSYPYFVNYIANDPRAEAEEERVRLCVQKGIDPYPYLQHRDHYYHNLGPVNVTDSEQVPQGIEEYQHTMERFRRHKQRNLEEYLKTQAAAKEVEQKEWTWAQRLLWYRFDKEEKRERDLLREASGEELAPALGRAELRVKGAHQFKSWTRPQDNPIDIGRASS